MRTRYSGVCILGSILGVIYLLTSFSFAAEWHDFYFEAQQQSKQKNWEKAIELYKKAIEVEPEPSTGKKIGMGKKRYFPYLELGLAYLGLGDIESAHQACTQSREKGIAPSETVDKCLEITSKFLGQLQMSTPASPPSQADGSPSITLTTVIPPEIVQKNFDLKGVVKGSHGIQELKLTVENLGIASMTTFAMQKAHEETFWITIPLDFGKNEITMEAIDTTGQIGKHTFTIVRQTSTAQTQEAIQMVTPTPLPPEKVQMDTAAPTPTPLQHDPLQDHRPSITLTSVVPEETEQDELTIEGFVTDDVGVSEVNVRIEKPGTRGLTLALDRQVKQADVGTFPFQKAVQLSPGQNIIIVEAINTTGQMSQQTLRIHRKMASLPEVDPAEDGLEKALSARDDIYAVIIGIGQYQDERLNLRFTVNDAQGLYNILTDPNYGGVPKDHIKLLLNEEATDRNIKGAIGRWLSREAQEDDTVLIYYSGHGAPEGRETYWVTYNADVDDLYTSALNNNDITNMLDRIRSRRVITFLDSCYSAATVNRKNRTRSIPTEIPWEKFAGEGRVTISASDGKELSLELEEYQHGVFTYYLLEGLKGKADSNTDGIVEVDEIWDYVKNQVRERARKAGNPQTPVFQGSVTAGIPLTYNKEHFEQNQQKKVMKARQKKLADLYEQGRIETNLFVCALKMLNEGTSNRWLDDLMDGKITPQLFNQFFTCE